MPQSEYVRLGYWSALASTVLGVAFVAALLTILVGSPSPDWWGPAPQLAPAMLYVSFGIALLGLPPLLALMVAIYGYAAPGRKLTALLAVLFTAICTAMVGVVYATQLAAVRHSVAAGLTEGLTPWLYQNTLSPIFAVDIFAYGFLGLAALAAAPVFEGRGLAAWLRRLLGTVAVVMLVGPVALVIRADLLST